MPQCRWLDEPHPVPTFPIVEQDVEAFASKKRAKTFRYLVGQFSRVERKSIEPMEQRLLV